MFDYIYNLDTQVQFEGWVTNMKNYGRESLMKLNIIDTMIATQG